MALMPKRTKFRKQQKGKMTGLAKGGTFVEFGQYGMQSLDDAILDAMQAKKISPEDAYDKSIVKERFIQYLKEPPEFL